MKPLQAVVLVVTFYAALCATGILLGLFAAEHLI